MTMRAHSWAFRRDVCFLCGRTREELLDSDTPISCDAPVMWCDGIPESHSTHRDEAWNALRKGHRDG